MVSKILSEKPIQMFTLPSPRVVSLPSLVDSGLHYSGLPKVTLLSSLRTGQYAAQEQRHIEGLGHVRPPM